MQTIVAEMQPRGSRARSDQPLERARLGRRRAWAMLLLVGTLTLPSVPLAHASGTVTNCTEADLRNALRGGGAVTLACDSTIQLTAPIIVSKEIILDGTGHSPTLSSVGTSNTAAMFIVQPGIKLVLRSVTLNGSTRSGASGTNGQSGESIRGGAIYVDHGEVSLEGCTLSGHSATGGDGSAGTGGGGHGGAGGLAAGAAVYNFGGQITVSNTVFSSNSATGGVGGTGGPGNTGTANDGGPGGDGGPGAGAAIYNTGGGLVAVFSSTFSSNRVTGSTAGLGGVGAGLFGNPGHPGAAGPGIGAAVFNDEGSVALVNSTFVGNRGFGAAGVNGLNGAGSDPGQNGKPGAAAEGAAVFNAAGNLSMTNCTIVDNALTGGNGGVGGAGQTAGFGGPGADGGSGGNALGAGVCNSSPGTTVIVNCTFSDNQVLAGQGASGGVGTGVALNGDPGNPGQAAGAAVYGLGGTIVLKNSILANSALASNAGGAISDGGFNLSSDATPAFSQIGSRNLTDPGLASFTTAGGITSTLTLSSNSPAIDAITVPGGNGGPAFDQRNAFRLEPFDIGAYELNGTFSAPGLQASLNANSLSLSWPASGNYTLQSTAHLSQSNSWTTVADPAVQANGLRILTVAPTNPASFYRLGTKP